jgi:hypothetical protein
VGCSTVVMMAVATGRPTSNAVTNGGRGASTEATEKIKHLDGRPHITESFQCVGALRVMDKCLEGDRQSNDPALLRALGPPPETPQPSTSRMKIAP